MKKIVLVGNPNCGKTTLFNKLTASREYVGNWSGVTVAEKKSVLRIKDKCFDLIDLPGIYSLSGYSEDEIVTRDYLFKNKIDLIVNIIDATNLERNLYLTSQLIDMGSNILLVFNMIDELDKCGIKINVDGMSSLVGLNVIKISAAKSLGIDGLINEIYEFDFDNKLKPKSFLSGTKEFMLASDIAEKEKCKLITAFKVIERDENFFTGLDEKYLLDKYKFDDKNWSEIIACDRYKFIDNLCARYIKKSESVNFSLIIDRVLLNKYLALPIFFLVMFFVFEFSFGLGGNFLSGLIEKFVKDHLALYIENFLSAMNANNVLSDLVTKGIIGGVGSILVFVPQITILFFFLCFIEDSGYISRVAFIMDKPLRKIGLSGKSFISVLLGFGCTVPAIMSVRTLDKKRDKILAIFLLPFISCSARVPIYMILANIFFKKCVALVVFSIYLLGIIAFVLVGLVLNKNFLNGYPDEFLMELPMYRLPVVKNLLKNVFDRVRDFVEKAGSILLLASIGIWFTQNFDFGMNFINDSSKSILGAIGKFIAPIFKFIGFGNWKLCSALLAGFIAKESIISSLNILFLNLKSDLREILSPLGAYCYMVFISLYMPCIATVCVIKRELNSYKLTLLIILTEIFVAWLVCFLIYNLGNLFLN